MDGWMHNWIDGEVDRCNCVPLVLACIVFGGLLSMHAVKNFFG